jgi:hypothetical protein
MGWWLPKVSPARFSGRVAGFGKQKPEMGLTKLGCGLSCAAPAGSRMNTIKRDVTRAK